MMSASHARRRTVAGRERLTVVGLARCWRRGGRLRSVSRSMRHQTARRGVGRPGIGVAVTMRHEGVSSAAGRSCGRRRVWPSRRRRRRRTRADKRASASGSRLIWVWHMPARSIHRRTERCDAQLLVVAEALVAGDAPGQVADVAGEHIAPTSSLPARPRLGACAANSSLLVIVRGDDAARAIGVGVTRRQRSRPPTRAWTSGIAVARPQPVRRSHLPRATTAGHRPTASSADRRTTRRRRRRRASTAPGCTLAAERRSDRRHRTSSGR